jgi:ubiquitin C
MPILVKLPTQKQFTLEVSETELIEDVKSMIEGKEGIPTDRQTLRFREIELENYKTLQDYSISRHAALFLTISSKSPEMTISVRTLNGEHFTLNVSRTERIEDVKTMIQEQQNHPFDQQELVFGGRKLENGRTLQDYSVPHEATIHLILRI